jgi:CDP-glycerol glycerophosphotransferase (TagB/SpsB family)
MLVTDYSSVFFDFAYMEKPVMYYQFDATKFQKYHYRQGVFSYQEHGFGPVIDNCDCAVDYIIDRIRSNYRMEDKYVDRVSDFFAYTDKKNTERNFEAICEL